MSTRGSRQGGDDKLYASTAATMIGKEAVDERWCWCEVVVRRRSHMHIVGGRRDKDRIGQWVGGLTADEGNDHVHISGRRVRK